MCPLFVWVYSMYILQRAAAICLLYTIALGGRDGKKQTRSQKSGLMGSGTISIVISIYSRHFSCAYVIVEARTEGMFVIVPEDLRFKRTRLIDILAGRQS